MTNWQTVCLSVCLSVCLFHILALNKSSRAKCLTREVFNKRTLNFDECNDKLTVWQTERQFRQSALLFQLHRIAKWIKMTAANSKQSVNATEGVASEKLSSTKGDKFSQRCNEVEVSSTDAQHQLLAKWCQQLICHSTDDFAMQFMIYSKRLFNRYILNWGTASCSVQLTRTLLIGAFPLIFSWAGCLRD